MGILNGSNDNGGKDPDDNVVRMPSLAERQRMQREEAAAEKRIHAAQNPPLINLPPATKILLLILLVIQAGMSLTDPVLRDDLYNRFGFTPAEFTGHLAFRTESLITPLSYAFLHGGWMHFGMNALMLAAMGAGTERWLGRTRFLIICFVCTLAAALAQTILTPMSTDPMIGASGAISGLFAAVLILIKNRRHDMGMTTTRLLPIAILWIVTMVVTGMLGMPGAGNIAWAAHVGGFLAGFAVLKVMRV